MCRDIERWEVKEVQIPGKKIEPQWPFLDTLLIGAPLGGTALGSIITSLATRGKNKP